MYVIYMQIGNRYMFYSNVTGLPVYSTLEVCIRRETAVCVTGHREKLIAPYRDDPDMLGITRTAVKLMLERYIDIVMDKGYTTLISGLAEGTDLWAADYVISRKRFASECKLIGIMPYLKHANGFSAENTELLKRVERHADLLITTCDNRNMIYGKTVGSNADPHVYRDRNFFMVDNSAAVIAFHSEASAHSGTGQTVRYAERLGKPIFSFGIDDVYNVIDSAGPDKAAIFEALKSIKFSVPKP